MTNEEYMLRMAKQHGMMRAYVEILIERADAYLKTGEGFDKVLLIGSIDGAKKVLAKMEEL